MTRRSVLAGLGIAIVVLASGLAAQQRPNFSGRWVTVSPADAAGQEETFTQDATTLTRTHGAEGDDHRFVYRLDGTESRNVLTLHGEDVVTISKASWSGDTLTIVSATTYPDGRHLNQTEVWSLGKDGRLTIDYTAIMDGQLTRKATVVMSKK